MALCDYLNISALNVWTKCIHLIAFFCKMLGNGTTKQDTKREEESLREEAAAAAMAAATAAVVTRVT